MIDNIKTFYHKLLPLSAREKLSPTLRRLLHFLNVLTFTNTAKNGIGGVKKIPFGSQAYRKVSFAQQGEDLVLDRILLRILNRSLSNGNYVDIGAYHPIAHSVTYLLYLRNWTGIAIDPSARTASEFKKKRPRDKFFQCVVGKENGIDVDFFFNEGSKNDLSMENTKYPKDIANYRKVKLHQRNLNDILKESEITEIDVLNIDIEGAEVELLKTFDFTLFKPKIVCVEIHGNDIVKCLESEIAKLLFSKGYKCVGCCVITFFFILESNSSDDV